MCSFTSLALISVQKLCDEYKLNESVHIGKEFNSHRTALVHLHVVRFIVSDVKMPGSYYPKSKANKSRVREQNNFPSFGNKNTSSRIPTEQA